MNSCFYGPAAQVAVLMTLTALCPSWSHAQENKPAFEVASVRPAVSGDQGMRMGGDPGRAEWANLPFKTIVGQAFRMKMYQISGPDWIASERYNITAKIPAGAARGQVPLMLQSLLVERFKLTFHREQRVMPVYELLAGKGDSKLHRSAPDSKPVQHSVGSFGRHLLGSATIGDLAKLLSTWLDRPLIDKTGVEGSYDIDLTWSGFEFERQVMSGGGGGSFDGIGVSFSADHPTIFSELRDKLGLRVQSGKGPVEVLVIDHAERVPTEN